MKRSKWLVLLPTAMLLLVSAAWAQMGTVKGVAKDEKGQPIVGATVQFTSKENGRKYEFKTDKKGEYYSLGVAGGTYDVALVQNGQTIVSFSSVPVRLGQDNQIDFDLAKEKAKAQQSGGAAAQQQKAEQEKVQKENTKIKGLNEKLASARADEQAGNFDQAIATLKDAIQVDPNQSLLWYSLGDAERLAAKKQADPTQKKTLYGQSVEDLKKAISMAPANKPDTVGAYYNNLGDAYVGLGQTQDAIQAYDQAAQANPPGAASYYFNEGAVLTNSGKADDANAAFDKALQADPTKADAYYWKGVNLMSHATLKGNKMEAPPEAAQAFNKYLELQPNGTYAQPAKDMLASMGEEVQTTYKGAKAKKK